MPKQNLRVHISERRARENKEDNFNFKFNDENDLYTLSKWLGEESNPTKENVSHGAKIMFRTDKYTDFDDYENNIYHLISWKLFEISIADKLFEYYKEYYKNESNWFSWFSYVQLQISTNRDFIFDEDPVFAENVIIDDINSNIFIIGDLHSSMHSLIDIMNELRDRNFFVNDTFQIKSNCYIFFLGDMVDRGPYGIEILCFVFMLKLKNKEKVYIINGNHEDNETYGPPGNDGEGYGLTREIKGQFDKSNINKINKIKNLLYSFPSVIFLKFGTKIYHLCHGAIDNKLKVHHIAKFISSEKKFMLIEKYNPSNTLKWGDLRVSNGLSDPGNGRLQFGTNIIKLYCEKTGISSLITGHQDMETLLIQPNINSQYYKKPELEIYVLLKKIIKLLLLDKYEDNDYRKKIINEINTSNNIGDVENIIKQYNISLGKHSYIYENLDIIKYIRIGPMNKRFKHCNEQDSCNQIYDLYSVYKKESFDLDPTQDFHALVTSTATISRNLLYNCYLELTQENTIIDIIKYCNL